MLSREEEKEKKDLQKDLLTILSFYRDVSMRSQQVKLYLDEEIERIVERLKELGR
jgi:hypothetical protein